MNAIRSIYKNAPDSIPVPEGFKKKDIEVIFLSIEESPEKAEISQFFGVLPNFPDREEQGLPQDRVDF